MFNKRCPFLARRLVPVHVDVTQLFRIEMREGALRDVKYLHPPQVIKLFDREGACYSTNLAESFPDIPIVRVVRIGACHHVLVAIDFVDRHGLIKSAAKEIESLVIISKLYAQEAQLLPEVRMHRGVPDREAPAWRLVSISPRH